MATLHAIIGGLQTALTTGSPPLFTTTTCFFAFDPKKSLNQPPSDQFAVIQPGDLKVPGRTFGKGQPSNARLNMLVTLTMTVWLFVRSATDEYNREDSYLFDNTYGSLVLTDSVIDRLQNYTLQDGTNLYGYELDEVIWPTGEKDSVGWAVTRLKLHTDLTGR
jgi:hypothetical protein